MTPEILKCEACGSKDVKTGNAEPGEETEMMCQDCGHVMTATRRRLTDVFGGGHKVAAGRMAEHGDGEFAPADLKGMSAEDTPVVTFDLSEVEYKERRYNELGELAEKAAQEYNVSVKHTFDRTFDVVNIRFLEL